MAFVARRLLPMVGRASNGGQNVWQSRLSVGAARFLCSESSEKLVSVEKSEDKIAIVKMHRKPVNAMNYPLLSQLRNTFDELEEDRGVKAIVISSDVRGIFSAGLDITEMYQATDESARRFWTSLQDMWYSLYTAGKPTIAAIDGASPAGGCLMACTCDYRIMAQSDKYSIGLNETRLGIAAPFWFVELFISVVGHRRAERALQLGTLFKPDQALEVGLVDEVVPSEQVMERAIAEAGEYMKINNVARRLTKQLVREQIADRFLEGRDNDVEMFVAFVMQDAVQASLGMYLEALQKKAGK